MAHSIALVERSSLLSYKIKTIAFNHDKLIFYKFPFDLNTLSLKADFNTAFNSMSKITCLRFLSTTFNFFSQKILDTENVRIENAQFVFMQMRIHL